MIAPNHLRILEIYNDYLESGGEQTAVNRIYDFLSQQNTIERCSFSSLEWKGASAPPIWQQPFRMLYNPSSVAKVSQLHSATRSDVWILHNVFPVGSGGIFREAIRQQVPVIYFIHNFRPFSVNGYLWDGQRIARGGLKKNYLQEIASGAWQESRLRTACFAAVLTAMHQMDWFKAVTTWVAISEFMRQRFIEAGIPADDILTVPHFWRARPEPPPPQDDGYYLFLGRLISAKGVKVLFKTWTHLFETMGEKSPHLVIAGDGPLAEEVRAFCEAHPRIRYVGQVAGEVKEQLLCGCRAMVAPSIWWEPLGLVTYEAYDHAKPMLAARSGGLSETVEHGVTGMLHEPGDARQLAEQIMEMDSNPALRSAMGQAGHQWLLKNANERLWQERINRVLEHTLQSRRAQ